MADNVSLNPGTGGATIRTVSDSSGTEWPVGVICYATSTSPGGGAFTFVNVGTGLPVQQDGAWTVGVSGTVPVSGTFWQDTQPVSISGTVPVSFPSGVTANAGTNLNTSALALETGGNLATLATNLPAKGQALAAASMPVVLTAAQLTTLTPLSTVAVTGTFWQTTQPISGTVTANAGTNLNTSTLALEAGGHLASVDTKTPALGQALAAASTPVVLTAAQITTLTPLTTVAVTGTFWQATQPVSGTFWQTTQPVSIASSVTVAQATAASLNATVVGTGTLAVQNTAATPAGTNLLGSIAESPQIGTAFNGTAAATVKYASFSTSSSGVTTIVAAVSGKSIYVLRWSVSSNGATNVNLQSHTTTSNATGIRYLTQFASGGGAYCPLGILATTAGEALDINNSAAVAISGELTYVQF